MFSDDANSPGGSLRDGKDRLIASVVALALALDIRLLRGGGTVFARHGLISPRVPRFTAFIVDPAKLSQLASALVTDGWREVPLGNGFHVLPPAIVRLGRDDFDGHIHLHGVIPGFFADPAAIFDFMWHNRVQMTVAGVEVPVLDRLCTVILATHDRLEGQGYRRAGEGENFRYFVTQFRAALTSEERDTLAWKVGLFGADDELRHVLEGLALPLGAPSRPSDEYVRARLGLEVVTAGDVWIIEHLERPRPNRHHGVPATSIIAASGRLVVARRRLARARRSSLG